MKHIICALLVASAVATPSRTERRATPEAVAQSACAELRKSLPNLTIYPIDLARYAAETTQPWSTSAWLKPACVFTPSNSSEAAQGISIFARLGARFAMRGGGHMPISDAANINSTGILLSSSQLTGLSLSQDKSTVLVQAGNRWSDVYDYLEPSGFSVVGGRIGMVGVAGLILGGGISYFSNEYGLASSNGNVKNLECVLGNGTIVQANPTANPDLYWALKGGGNSFCFVTRFDLRTINSSKVYVGLRTYTTSQTTQWLKSVVDFAFNSDYDTKGSIVPSVTFGPLLPITYTTYSFYNGNNSSPSVLQNFSAPVLPPLASTWSYRSMAAYSGETDVVELPFKYHRQRFYGQAFHANLDAFTVVHDMFINAVKTHLYDIPDMSATMDFNVVPKAMIHASNSDGGNPQGVSEDQGPYIWLNEIIAYLSSANDAKVDQFLVDVNANITAELNRRNVNSKSIYLNEIDRGQQVFQGYPSENVDRLKRIRASVDPGRVFTDLVPGGFKVEYA